MNYLARQKKFQQTLQNEHLDGFVVTHAANLRYLCGYTGSNGLLLFLNGRKTFFTDGRYTEQAGEEVKGARIVIPKVWEREGRKVSRVAEKLSISPKKVRRILQLAGVSEKRDVHHTPSY